MDESTTGTTGTEGGGAGDRFGKAKEFAREKVGAASDAMKNQYNRVRERVDDVDFGAIADQVRSYVRSNPGKALLISVGAGFLIGLLLRRSSDED